MAIVAPVLGFTPKSHIHSLTPPKTSADVDLDNRFAEQYDRILKKMDRFLTILNLTTYIQRTLQRFPGQSGVQTVPEPPQPHDKSASVRSREGRRVLPAQRNYLSKISMRNTKVNGQQRSCAHNPQQHGQSCPLKRGKCMNWSTKRRLTNLDR